MNGIINRRQTTLLDDIFFRCGRCQLLFAGRFVFVNVCFLITAFLAQRGQCQSYRMEFEKLNLYDGLKVLDGKRYILFGTGDSLYEWCPPK